MDMEQSNAKTGSKGGGTLSSTDPIDYYWHGYLNYKLPNPCKPLTSEWEAWEEGAYAALEEKWT